MHEDGLYTRVGHCLKLNQILVEELKNPGTGAKEDAVIKLRDQQSRFAVWSGNLGANRYGATWLEYQLRDASHIRKNVISLLDELEGLVEDARAILSGETTPWDQLPDDAPQDEDEADQDGAADVQDEDMPETELDQIALDVAEVVDGLLRLSMSIRNPAPHDRFIASLPTETSHFEASDIQYVQSRFTSLPYWLAERLGKAISRRRQYFRYRQAHHEAIPWTLGMRYDMAVFPITMASSIPEKIEGEKYPGAEVDDYSAAGARSVFHKPRLRVPPLFREAGMEHFVCRFCYMMIIARTRTDWK